MPNLRAAGLLACALLLAGCGFGEESWPQEITSEQLAVMVLPRDELGTPAGFEVDSEDSGRITAREAAEATTDPRDNAADLKQAGWLGGYELTYSDPNRSVSFERGEGVVMGDSTVQLFDTETSARAHLLREIRDFERFRGQVVDGVRLARFETFEIDVGDEGWGIELTARARGVTLHGTGVVFRSGRLTADAGFLHVDQADMRGEAIAVARALQSRIERVLAGDLDAEPVPLPVEEPSAPTVNRAQLARATLALEDLPAGAHLSEEGRLRTPKSAGFYRTFDVQDTMIGGSHLLFLRAQTQVFETEASAELMMRYLSNPKGRAQFAREVLQGFKKLAGARARNVQVTTMTQAGRDATGIVVTFDLPAGRFRTATVLVRSGRSVAVVSGFCTAHAVHPDDLPPLGDKARARLRSIPV
jgi:hypothetical protein